MLIAYVFCIYISERHFSLIISMVIGSAIFGAGALLNVWGGTYYILRQHRTMGAASFGGSFAPIVQYENGKYTEYSRIFHTFAWVKISRRISLPHYAVLP